MPSLNMLMIIKNPDLQQVNVGTSKETESDNSLLYGILTLILAVIMLTLLQVNSNLKKLSDEKEGIPSVEAVPFYRNKVYIAFLVLILFVVGGYYLGAGSYRFGKKPGLPAGTTNFLFS